MPELVVEAVEAAGTATPQSGGVFLIDLITPGWGSSGYYTAEVLEQAARDRVFPAGTQMFINHQTAQERNDRPEGDMRDLAAALQEDAYWDSGAQALRARSRVFSPWRHTLDEMKEHIGASIRASAEVTYGEAEGRPGKIVERLVDAQSVDFVTRAGRGGRIVEVLEAATVTEARNVGQWIESMIHRDFTITADDMAGDGRLSRDERIGLSAAIGDALNAFVTRLEADHPQLYQRDLWEEPDDTVAAALEALHNVPVSPAGQSINQESKEDTMATTQIEESELSGLREKAGRVPTLESERDTAAQRAEEAEARANVAEAELARRDRVAEANKVIDAVAEAKGVEFDGLQRRGLTADLPTTEAGAFDADEFTKTVESEADKALKRASESGGSLRGFGPSSTVSEADAAFDEMFTTERKGA